VIRTIRLMSGTLAAVALLSGCGASTPTSAAPSGPGLRGLVLRPAKAAPALSLRDFTGQPVNLTAFRGKAVLVTFVYTHCPDVCPLIVSSLAAGQRELGPKARTLQILAVTVDPHRDTPSAIKAFLAARQASGRMDYLLGTHSQLARTWKAWGVAVQTGPNTTTTGHSAVVYGITASGRLAVVYPSNLDPGEIVHDVPLLARS
jgi:protein SCO1/2